MSFTRSGVPFLVTMTVCSMSWTRSDQSDVAHIDLLQTLLDEASTGVDVVVGELLLDLGQAQAVGDQLVGINPNLVFARGAAEAGYVDNVGYRFEILFDDPVFNGFQLHGVVGGIGAVQGEEIDLADRTPVRAHLRNHAGRQSNLSESLQNPFPIPGIVRAVFEN